MIYFEPKDNQQEVHFLNQIVNSDLLMTYFNLNFEEKATNKEILDELLSQFFFVGRKWEQERKANLKKIEELSEILKRKEKRIESLQEKISSSFLSDSNEEKDKIENCEISEKGSNNYKRMQSEESNQDVLPFMRSSTDRSFQERGRTTPFSVGENQASLFQRRNNFKKRSTFNQKSSNTAEEERKKQTYQYVQMQELMNESLRENTKLKEKMFFIIEELNQAKKKASQVTKVENMIEKMRVELSFKEKHCKRYTKNIKTLKQKLKDFEIILGTLSKSYNGVKSILYRLLKNLNQKILI